MGRKNWSDLEVKSQVDKALAEHSGESDGPGDDGNEDGLPDGMHLVGEEVTEDTDEYQQKQVERMYL